MPDIAHEWTDDRLEQLVLKMREEYLKASFEMSDKLNVWLEDFESQNRGWQKAVKEGFAEEADYKLWLEDQMQDKLRQQGMIDQLTYDAINADIRARQLINNEIPTVLCENGNYAAYDIDRQANLDTAFELYNQDAVRNLIANEPELLPKLDLAKDVAWNRQKLTSAITQSILQGDSIPHTMERLQNVLGISERSAERVARTAMTCAESRGRQMAFDRADSLGIPLKKKWHAHIDGRTRLAHRQADGQTVGVHDMFVVDGHKMTGPGDPTAPGYLVWNCFTPENKVIADSEILASYKHEYSGKLVTVHTSAGIDFTCTPNHPILTVNGWVSAERLHKGSDLLITSVIDSEIPSGYPDINHVMPSFEAVHELLCMLSVKRTRCLGVNFHGDVAASYVEIVGKEGLLWVDWDSVCSKELAEFLLEHPYSFCSALRSFGVGLGGVVGATSGSLSSERVSLAFLGGHLAHPNAHGLGTSSVRDSSFVKNLVNDLSAMPNLDGELLGGLSGKVGIDNVVSIEVKYGTGQVYNLQTKNGYYLVGGNNGITIIAKNCRCNPVGEVDREGIPERVVHRHKKLPKNVSYEDWKAGKYVTDRFDEETDESKKERGVE